MPAPRTPARASSPRSTAQGRTRTTAPTRTATTRATAPTRTAPTRTRAASAPRRDGRPPLTPAEAAALRDALAARDAHVRTVAPAHGRTVAARPGVTPEQLAAARAAVAARRSGGSPSTRTPGRRPAAGRSAVRRAPARSRKKPAPTPRERTGSRWSTRIGVVATSALLLPVVLALGLPAPDQPTGGTDTVTLALTARSSLLEQADRYRQLERAADHRRARLQQARDAEEAAEQRFAAKKSTVGAGAALLYRSGPADRLPVLALDTHTADAAPAVFLQQAVAEQTESEIRAAVVHAQRAASDLRTAGARVEAARADLAAAEARAEEVLVDVRAEVDELSPAVSGVLAGIGTIPVAGPQQDRNDAVMRRWQDYLTRLATAGIAPPPAASITDPAALPDGFSPALDADGRPLPGVVWGIIGTEPVTVLPAETVAAVSNALSQLGKPFVAGSAGPDTYDCGGFTAASWLMGGYALARSPRAQWAGGTAVPVRDLQVGDLVFSPGGADVGMYLGDGDVVGASAATYQVGVRSLAPGASATRVTAPAPSGPNAPLPALADRIGDCGAPLPVPGPVNPAWGGWSNGRIPVEALCRLGVDGHALRCDAAASYAQLAEAYTAEFGATLCITDSYRSFGGQVAAFRSKPALAAVPGTSNHGWALAVDLCGGINVAGTPQWSWMTAHAARFGFVQPDWARPGAEKPEPWHWEFGYIS
ncbi:NlpC/P60 family protein [Blastococcus sp. LR1]|uniref:NlpC/P60 family protein n=1 Tax=Blastococcus sp. LR1 TaxID=2877000 RepID=UPI001CCE45FB|nr:NlpC/P60 family protein [Blastococcus sp. LR1]MCA0144470.1 D-alanyl-D-alanine carboxypeptidase family protein [Blastococcus sp. LR1]